MCPPHLRGTSTSPTANSLSHRIVKKDLAFGFFGHYIVIADINRFSAIAEQHAGGLWLNYAPVDSIGQRNSYVKTWGCGGFLNETNIYSRGKSLCF